MKIVIAGTGYVGLSNGTLLAQYNTAVALNINSLEPLDHIDALENSKGIEAKKELLPLQPGVVPDTYANDLVKDFYYKPSMSVKESEANFGRWYKNYHKILKNSYASH